jgi:hypothetical protein
MPKDTALRGAMMVLVEWQGRAKSFFGGFIVWSLQDRVGRL